MTYEIIVDKQGKHIFATREYCYADARSAYLEISKNSPLQTATRWESLRGSAQDASIQARTTT